MAGASAKSGVPPPARSSKFHNAVTVALEYPTAVRGGVPGENAFTRAIELDQKDKFYNDTSSEATTGGPPTSGLPSGSYGGTPPSDKSEINAGEPYPSASHA